MKQISIVARPSKIDDVVESLRKSNVGGLTITEIKGEGRADPPLVGDTFSMKQINVVVEDEKVKPIFNNVSAIACTGQKGDGKLFVTNIEDALDICTKKTGNEAL